MSTQALLPKKGLQEQKSLGTLVKENFLPGVTVALVSVPLSTALSMAAGATPMMGLITAIWGPLIQGVLGGSNYNILGPAGALVAILQSYTSVYGPQIIPWLAIGCGIISGIIYSFGWERYAIVLPLSVLEGFSFAVALTIGLSQLKMAFGLGKVKVPIHREFYLNVYEILIRTGDLVWADFLVFLVLFAGLMWLQKYRPGKPWIVVIAIVGVIYGSCMAKWGPEDMRPLLLRELFPTLGDTDKAQLWQFGYWSPKLPEAAPAASSESDLTFLKGSSGDDTGFPIPFSEILSGSAKVAFVAVLETLISARIADNLTGTRFESAPECRGMAIANVASGLLGGTPCTGVLVRTAVNCASGATHKTSQFINAVVVLSMVLVLMPVFSYIPMAAIAAMLITSSCRLVPMKIMAAYWKLDPKSLLILLATTGACVFVDGALGLAIGAMICLLRQAVESEEGQLELVDEAFGDQVINSAIAVQGPLTYITAYHIETTLTESIVTKDPQYVVISLEDVTHFDLDGLDALKNVMKLRNKRRMAVVEPAPPTPEGTTMTDRELQTAQFYIEYFKNSKICAELSEEGLVFADRYEAAKHLQGLGPLDSNPVVGPM